MKQASTILGMSEQQQQKPIKVTKVRRTRQPRNPQLSVARRNERERNRVKMVNNGFALLREHLPVEDLQAFEGSGSDTPTPDGGSVNGNKSSGKAKKFSKVETLRAAIQRIKVLEELIRSTDAEFESMNHMMIMNGQQQQQHQPASLIGLPQQVVARSGESRRLNQLSMDEEPLSCASSSGNSTTTIQIQESSQFHYSQQQQQPLYPQQNEQFIRLAPQQHAYNNLPSPQNSQSSRTSSALKQLSPSQVHPQTHLNLNSNQQQQQQMLSCSPNPQDQQQPSHTHLWIQQHQSSFMEQQLEYQQQQQQLDSPQQTSNWYSSQQQQQLPHLTNDAGNLNRSNWFLHQQTGDHLQAPQSSSPQQQPQIVESPVGWFSSSNNNNNNQTSTQTSIPQSSTSQPIAFAHYHQQHQISLYSQ